MNNPLKKARKTRLERFSLTMLEKRHLPLLAKLLVYFNGQRRYAFVGLSSLTPSERAEYVHPLPLTKVYRVFKVSPRDRCLVHYAANIFFIHQFRGNSWSRKCSGWNVRKKTRVNERLLKLLTSFYRTHAEYFAQVMKVITTKTENQKIEVTVTAKFEITADQASELVTVLRIIQQRDLEPMNEIPDTEEAA